MMKPKIRLSPDHEAGRNEVERRIAIEASTRGYRYYDSRYCYVFDRRHYKFKRVTLCTAWQARRNDESHDLWEFVYEPLKKNYIGGKWRELSCRPK